MDVKKSLPLRLRFPRFPVAVEFTSEGLIFVLLCLAIGAAAVNTGNNVLYLLFSLMLGLIVVSGMVSRRMLLGLSVRVDFPEHLFSGVQNVCYVTVANRKRKLPSIGVRFAVTEPFFPHINRHFFYISSLSESHDFAPVVFPKRGLFKLSEMELQTRFPFSFFLKIRRFFPDQSVRVYPRIYRLSEEVAARFTEGMLISAPYRGESHQILHLRDYNSYDSSKRIHWKASAKMEKLLVKEFEREQGRDLYLYFNCYPTGTDDGSEMILDQSISFLASVAFLFSEKGIAGTILFPDRSFEIGSSGSSMIPLLSYLAELKAGVQPEGKWRMPENSDAIVVQICSKRTHASIPLEWPACRKLFVEDWAHLFRDSVVTLK